MKLVNMEFSPVCCCLLLPKRLPLALF